ncbi:MAG: GNAT family N-acetyltransferase, partial [Alphaproteobacteria bacterium]
MARQPAGLHIRAFREADAAILARLFHESVHGATTRDYSEVERRAWSPAIPDARAWAARMAARTTLVAEHAGVIVGFAELEPPDHLDLLYVSKDHQGLGVASALLAAVEDRARRAGATRLVTAASLTARPFFAGRGFTITAD